MKRILLIDDQESVGLVLKPIIEAAGFEFDRLEKFVELPRMMLRNPPNIIILDLTMPGLAGVKIGELVRKRRPELPIIIYSARDLVHRKHACEEIGANAHVGKSEDKSILVDTIRQVLRRTAA